jgi:transcriptional regulator of acetoin/glycerol metabolism
MLRWQLGKLFLSLTTKRAGCYGPEGAAARLGMKRSTLYKKMKKLGISRLD